MSDGQISATLFASPSASLMMAGILFVGLGRYPLLPVATLRKVIPTSQVAPGLPGGSPEPCLLGGAAPRAPTFAQDSRHRQMTSTSYLGTTAVTISSTQSQHRTARDQRM